MNAITINFHNDQERKILLSILDSLDYDYEPKFSPSDEASIEKALNKSSENLENNRFSTHSDVVGRVTKKYGL